VILEGSAEVLIDGERQADELRGGDFFGELAALDWGAGYTYSRTATVRATSHMRLLVIPAEGLRSLLGRLPFIESRIRAAVRRHLKRI
jgi:aromatic-L-amino-acid/L-tryptophan decarboxylase